MQVAHIAIVGDADFGQLGICGVGGRGRGGLGGATGLAYHVGKNGKIQSS
jgi:hypothetical protein